MADVADDAAHGNLRSKWGGRCRPGRPDEEGWRF
jgi:hypothetical protein